MTLTYFQGHTGDDLTYFLSHHNECVGGIEMMAVRVCASVQNNLHSTQYAGNKST